MTRILILKKNCLTETNCGIEMNLGVFNRPVLLVLVHILLEASNLYHFDVMPPHVVHCKCFLQHVTQFLPLNGSEFLGLPGINSLTSFCR
jgi:hypothetical protein